MNAEEIRAIVACWMRYQRQYPIIAFERGLYPVGRPDVCAVTNERKLVEVEIKISLSDFKADSKKNKNRFLRIGLYTPYMFYYAVPNELVEKVKPLLPDGAGLLTPLAGWSRNLNRMNPNTGLPDIHCVVKAKRTNAPNLDMKTMWEMVRHQSGTICSLITREAKNHSPGQ